MQEFFWRHDASIKSVFVVILLVLVMWIVSLQSQLTFVPATPPEVTTNDVCGEDCRKAIQEIVIESVATLSASPKIVYISPKQTGNQQKVTYNQQVTYIPIPGGFSTRLTEWSDVARSEVYIDLAEYSQGPYIDWEATVKAVSGNIQVRLFDTTHAIAVGASEIKSVSSTFTTVSSGVINLWQGRNLYRVQVKSLDGSEVFFDSGRIKIVSK